MNLMNMTATNIGLEIRNRNISCKEVLDEFFKDFEDKGNSYISLCKDYSYKRALEIQKKIDNKEEISILAGVPISIKDNICTKDIKTTSASKMLENYIPYYNATVIDKLEKEGAIIIGKLNLDEFAMGDMGITSYYGKCKNPWDIEKTTGGSSSGCVSSLAYNEAICTLGSDTGGSARQPASFCNQTSIKPSYGIISRYGLIGFAPEFDQICPITKDAIDCLNIMKIISGKDKNDDTTIYYNFRDLNISSLKIGICKNFLDYSDDDVASCVLDAIKIFKNCKIEEINFNILDYVTPTYQVLSSVYAVSNMARYDNFNFSNYFEDDSYEDICISSRTKLFGKEVKKRIMYGNYILNYTDYYDKALKSKQYINKIYSYYLDKYDVIIMPTTPKTAFSYNENFNTDIFLIGSNLTKTPSISIPCGFDRNNMPIGMQIISKNLNDDLLLNLAIHFQENTDFHLKNPKI